MNPEKASAKMSHVADIRDELHDAMIRVAGPREWSDTRESWIARAARRAGVPFRTARAVFYREIRDPKWSVVETIRAAARAFDEHNESKSRDELIALRARIERLEQEIADARGARAGRDRLLASDACQADRAAPSPGEPLT